MQCCIAEQEGWLTKWSVSQYQVSVSLTVPVQGAELHDFLEQLRLLLRSYVQKKAQNQLRPQTLEDRVHTLRLPTTHTHTCIRWRLLLLS